MRPLAILWLGAFSVSAALLLVGLRQSSTGWDLTVALPYSITPAALWHTLAAVFIARPLESTALIMVPFLTLVATLVCLAIRRCTRHH